MAFREVSKWARKRTYLDTNKRVFDAEVFAILLATQLLSERGESGQAILSSRTPRRQFPESSRADAA